MSSPLAGVRRFIIPGSLLDSTLRVLVKSGRKGFEAFVVWGGVVSDEGTSLHVVSFHVPEQTAHKTPEGLLVTVGGDALFEINKELYRCGEILCGQVHSHPTHAFHSETDDHFPLVTLTGSLSIVVPNFAIRGRADIQRWAWYRLVGAAVWEELNRDDRVEIRNQS